MPDPLSRTARGVVLGAALAAVALAIPLRARACSVCGCGDPLLTSSDPAAIVGRLRLQLDTEYLRVDAGNEDDPAATDKLAQWTVRLNAVWRPLDTLSLTATLPVVNKDLRTVGAAAPAAASDATGLGDVEVGARWAVWRGVDLGLGRVQEVAITAGTSTPTGPNDVAADGVRIDEHGQPGTGSWGPFAGLAYRFEEGRWVAFGSVAARGHTANSYGYRYGGAALWSAHGQWFPARRVALDLGIDGRWAAVDRDPGGAVPNTGGTVLAIAPGAYLDVGRGAWLFLRGQIPFYKQLVGVQDQLPSFVTGIQYQVL